MIFDKMRKGTIQRQHNALSVLKMHANKNGNLRRRRMELRKMRIVTNQKMFGDSDSRGESPQKKRYIGFEEESIEEEETSIDPKNVVVTRGVTCGMRSVIGRRREMEDAVAVELGFLQRGGKSYDFFGVYDGHGGWRVAEACSEMLHKLLVKIILIESENCGDIINWGKVMGEGFKKMDEEVNNKNGREVAMTGSTAVVAVVGDDEVVVANCGDSRALLFRGGAAVQLSDDHKPDRPDELERIEDMGGKVINWNGQRVLGVLATSRSIGDHYLKPFVINEPEVKVISRTDSDEFLILASDGLWDVISNDLACEVTKTCFDGKIRTSSPREEGSDRCGNNRASVAAAVLAELAIARGSGDNISVVVVELKRSAC